MNTHTFYLEKPLDYHWVGKFEAPGEDWIHLKRFLTDYELIVVIEGCLYITDDVQQYVVHSGEYLIMTPGNSQYGYKPSKCTFYWLHFVQGMADEDSPQIQLPLQHTLPRLERVIVLFKQLQDSERRYHNHVANNFFTTVILTEIYNQYQDMTNTKNIPIGKEQLYTDIVDYVSWHIGEPIKVSQIAKYYGYNEKYLTTFFKRISGIPLKTYIMNEKMELAKSLLVDTNDTISQIGYCIGFSDNHNFSSSFKKLTGMSPSEYRASFAKRLLFHE